MPGRRVPIAERGPDASYLPDSTPPHEMRLHQPGIATPFLDHLAFAALDLTAVAPLASEARRMMAAAAGDLTVTIGLGPGAFADAAQRPVALAELPSFPGDELDPASCGGDLALQVCARDAGHADATLSRLIDVAGVAPRWVQRGFSIRDGGARPRNLLGFKDGTNNLRRGWELDRHVWITGRDRAWMLGGTYVVVRRVRIDLAAWDRLPQAEQERIIGRHKASGAPLGRRLEFDSMPDAVPPNAHARLAAPRANGGAAMLRRAYSYDNGAGDAGLFLLLYVRDPRRQFVPVQRHLAAHDALARFTATVGSAVFAVPPVDWLDR